MHVELRCDRCGCHFHGQDDALKRLSAEGPWSALGDGETFEDRLSADLGSHDCPRCGSAVRLSEEGLGQLSLQLLGQW